MAKVIHATGDIWQGVSREYDGVTQIINVGTKDEIVIVYPPQAAAEVGAQLNL